MHHGKRGRRRAHQTLRARAIGLPEGVVSLHHILGPLRVIHARVILASRLGLPADLAPLGVGRVRDLAQ
eukprot:10596975-Alexandrium_andersonii.AAC.1